MMFVVGVLLSSAVCLIAYLFGGLIWMTITAWASIPLILLWGVIEFRRFERERAKAIAQRLSAS